MGYVSLDGGNDCIMEKWLDVQFGFIRKLCLFSIIYICWLGCNVISNYRSVRLLANKICSVRLVTRSIFTNYLMQFRDCCSPARR